MKASLLAFSLICSALIGIAAAGPEPVLDTSGKKLRTGVKYHILPVLRGKGGGLTVASRANSTCPLFVVQEKLHVLSGTPVTFTPYNAKEGLILTSTDLNIKSTVTSSTCDASPVWRLLKEISEALFVSTGGVEGSPGFDTIFNWFKIEKAGKGYKIFFCPSVCNCGTTCSALGIFTDADGSKHLALADRVTPFTVVFKRA